MGWTKCSCGHIANHHNQIPNMGQSAPGPVSGNPHGYWTDEDVASIEVYRCDHDGCSCKGYDGVKVEAPGERAAKRIADRVDGYDRDDLGESPDF